MMKQIKYISRFVESEERMTKVDSSGLDSL
jgi:hypothetical protein